MFSRDPLPLQAAQDLRSCCLVTHCPLPAATQGPAGPVVLSSDPLLAATQGHAVTVVFSQEPMPSACRCSSTCRNCAVSSGPTVPCLPLIREGPAETVLSWDPLPIAGCSGTCRTFGVVSGHTTHSLAQLRGTQDLCCPLTTHCPLPSAAQGAPETAGPVVLSQDPLPPACCCSGTRDNSTGPEDPRAATGRG